MTERRGNYERNPDYVSLEVTKFVIFILVKETIAYLIIIWLSGREWNAWYPIQRVQ